MLAGTHVPRKEDKHRSNRDLANKPLEALLRLAVSVLEYLLTYLDEILGPADGCGHFLCSISNGPTHLGSQLEGQLICVIGEHFERLLDDLLSFCQSSLAPGLESLGRSFGQTL